MEAAVSLSEVASVVLLVVYFDVCLVGDVDTYCFFFFFLLLSCFVLLCLITFFYCCCRDATKKKYGNEEGDSCAFTSKYFVQLDC